MLSQANNIFKHRLFLYANNNALNLNLNNVSSDSNAVFPERRLFFNRIKKNANTFIMSQLYSSINGANSPDRSKIKASVSLPQKLSAFEILDFRHYYSFVVVRNPYSRILSGFLQKISKGDREKYQGFDGFGEDSKIGFEAFLSQLCHENLLYKNRHFYPQTSLLLFSPKKYTKIIKFENLNRGLLEVYQEVGLPQTDELSVYGQHKNENNYTGAAEKFDDYYTAKSLNLVNFLYRDDFVNFGYEPVFD